MDSCQKRDQSVGQTDPSSGIIGCFAVTQRSAKKLFSRAKYQKFSTYHKSEAQGFVLNGHMPEKGVSQLDRLTHAMS